MTSICVIFEIGSMHSQPFSDSLDDDLGKITPGHAQDTFDWLQTYTHNARSRTEDICLNLQGMEARSAELKSLAQTRV